ncbi:MAG: hypothetical protein V4795_00525 [Pseudomonadota bacterium]
MAVELVARATRRASCCAWSRWPRSTALRVGVEPHQAELLRGLQRAELLPLVVHGAELAALDHAAGRCRAEPGRAAAGPARAELLPLALRLVDAAGVELLGVSTVASCRTWSRWPLSVALPAGVELHQAEAAAGPAAC